MADMNIGQNNKAKTYITVSNKISGKSQENYCSDVANDKMLFSISNVYVCILLHLNTAVHQLGNK